MKKLNLKFFGRGAKIVLPLFLLVGLFLASATTTVAQDFKSMEDVQQIVKTELTKAIKAGGVQSDLTVNPTANSDAMAEYEYFKYLKQTLIIGDVAQAVNQTYQKMQLVYPQSPMKEAIFKAHQKALEILTY